TGIAAACPSRRTRPAWRPTRGGLPRAATASSEGDPSLRGLRPRTPSVPGSLALAPSLVVDVEVERQRLDLVEPGVGQLARLLQPVFDEKVQVVALVQDLDLRPRVQRSQLADLTVLLGDELLVQRGDLDVQVVGGKVEVGTEGEDRRAEPVPFEDELLR